MKCTYMKKTSCDNCIYFEYDDEYECDTCSMNLDDDEMYRFMQNAFYNCPDYKYGDEYTIVRKQI